MANKFEKVSKEQFEKNRRVEYYIPYLTIDNDLPQYKDIIIPARATKASAGYDFYLVTDVELRPGETVKVPTGIRANLDDDKFLMIVPRSGLGFKYRLQLDNTLGIIDADYYHSDNEGHIWIKITNDSREGKVLTMRKGEGFAQGIIMQYFKTDDDNESGVRNGGFGSTTNKP